MRPLRLDHLSREQLINLVQEQAQLLHISAPAIMATHKLCPACSRYLPHKAFFRRAQSRDGLQSRCKECQRPAVDAWRSENREYISQKNKADYERKKCCK